MNQHAVIIGGGIGGLLAAQALTEAYQQITILERDHYPGTELSPAPPARQGVPQSRCPHLLMAAGAAAFDELTPGWREKLVALGAVQFDASADARMRLATGWLPRTTSGITLYACSRSLLEHVLYSELESDPTVQLHTGERVLGLLYNRSSNRVTGVHTSQRGCATSKEIPADLVVDTSGSTSALRHWLAHQLPHTKDSQTTVTTIAPGRRYVSSWFHIEPGDAPDWHCLAIAPGPQDEYRAAMMLRAEHERWGVVLIDSSVDPLPAEHKSFMNFTSNLGNGSLNAVLERARPVSRVHRLPPAANRWRHYDRMGNWPLGLVALGDSVCALDPYFGLGMTAAARGAVLLKDFQNRHDKEHLNCQAFQKELAQLNAQPWQLATRHDTDGRPLANTALHIGRLYDVAPSSPKVAHAILAVQHLLCPMDTLMKIDAA